MWKGCRECGKGEGGGERRAGTVAWAACMRRHSLVDCNTILNLSHTPHLASALPLFSTLSQAYSNNLWTTT